MLRRSILCTRQSDSMENQQPTIQPAGVRRRLAVGADAQSRKRPHRAESSDDLDPFNLSPSHPAMIALAPTAPGSAINAPKARDRPRAANLTPSSGPAVPVSTPGPQTNQQGKQLRTPTSLGPIVDIGTGGRVGSRYCKRRVLPATPSPGQSRGKDKQRVRPDLAPVVVPDPIPVPFQSQTPVRPEVPDLPDYESPPPETPKAATAAGGGGEGGGGSSSSSPHHSNSPRVPGHRHSGDGSPRRTPNDALRDYWADMEGQVAQYVTDCLPRSMPVEFMGERGDEYAFYGAACHPREIAYDMLLSPDHARYLFQSRVWDVLGARIFARDASFWAAYDELDDMGTPIGAGEATNYIIGQQTFRGMIKQEASS